MKDPQTTPEEIFLQKRIRMIDHQIKARAIKDERVLSALLKVKRHDFVPINQQHLSYEDYPLPIGQGQTISQPYIVALMTQLLELKSKDRVLEIGTGSGYQTAILAELAKEVYTLEIVEPLTQRAQEVLSQQGYTNIHIRKGDGFEGWSEHAPFDAIIVTCAPVDIPKALIGQLAEQGRLVIPVGRFSQQLKQIQKINGQIKEKDVALVQFVPMVHPA